jgi:hypothetical protein
VQRAQKSDFLFLSGILTEPKIVFLSGCYDILSTVVIMQGRYFETGKLKKPGLAFNAEVMVRLKNGFILSPIIIKPKTIVY